MTAFLDTNVIVRHLTGEPADMAAASTAYLRSADHLLLADLIVAETVYVLESFYEQPRDIVAGVLRSVLAFPPVSCVDPALLLRALEVYEVDRVDFAEAYLVACAESAGVEEIASFDRTLDRVASIRRVAPGT